MSDKCPIEFEAELLGFLCIYYCLGIPQGLSGIHYCGFFFFLVLDAVSKNKEARRISSPGTPLLYAREKVAKFYHFQHNYSSIRQSLSHGHLGGFSKFRMLS